LLFLRKKEMEVHKPKFVKGFFLEIVVIVIGISLAIGAERWVEHARETKEAKRVMTRMIAELARDSSDLEFNINYVSQAAVSDSLLTRWSQGNLELENDSITVHANNSLLSTYFASNTAEVEALKGSGKLHLIENEELLSKLLKHYDRYADFEIYRGWAERFTLELMDMYKRNSSLTTQGFFQQPTYQFNGAELSKGLRGNQLFENTLQQKKLIDLFIVSRTKVALKRATVLLSELRQEVAN
jgi:hypothetical protein